MENFERYAQLRYTYLSTHHCCYNCSS